MIKTSSYLWVCSILITIFSITIVSCDSATSLEKEQLTEVEMTPYNPVDFYSAKDKGGIKKEPVSPYSCVISTLNNSDAEHLYRYNAYWLRFPRGIVKKANGKIRKEIYVLGSDLAGDRAVSIDNYKNIVRVAKCTIPDTESAGKLLKRQVEKFNQNSWISDEKSSKNVSGSQQTLGCDEYFITIVCIISTKTCEITDIRCISYDAGGGGGGEDDGSGGSGDDPDPCSGERNRYDPHNCNGGGGGGGGSPLIPDICDEADAPAWCSDPCDTGDPIIDSRGVQETFENLYEKSDFDKPIEQRTEQGGFITRNSEGVYGFAEFPSSWPRSACGIDPPSNFLDAVPDNTVGFVHTHPFFEGEDTRSVCGNNGVENYTSGFGEEDLNTLIQVANHLEDHTIKGYVLDGNNIVTYTTLSFTGPEDLNSRCGY